MGVSLTEEEAVRMAVDATVPWKAKLEKAERELVISEEMLGRFENHNLCACEDCGLHLANEKLRATIELIKALVPIWRVIERRAREELELDLLDEEVAIYAICADELEAVLKEEKADGEA